MPLIKNEAGDPESTVCLNDCGALSRLDQEVQLTVKGGDPVDLTVLVCPVCHYCETYYGAV
jgi:hypothetical protein